MSNLKELAIEFQHKAQGQEELAGAARSRFVFDPETNTSRIKDPFAVLYHELQAANLHALSDLCEVLYKELKDG